MRDTKKEQILKSIDEIREAAQDGKLNGAFFVSSTADGIETMVSASSASTALKLLGAVTLAQKELVDSTIELGQR